MSKLRGPADPENYRIEDQWRRRWYVDPLPADSTWAASTEKWPAITTVKKGWEKEFKKKIPDGPVVALDAYRVAMFVADNLATVNSLMGNDRPAAVTLMATSAQRDLNKAAKRGSDVHKLIEDISDGNEPMEEFLEENQRVFLPIIRQMIAELRPTFVMSEAVLVNRELGVGGTVDAIIEIDGKFYVVDWKTRGETSEHGCYEEEVCQVSFYGKAQYAIITGENGQPCRIKLPDLAGAIVVSLKVDSYRVFPVDVDKGFEALEHLVSCWRRKADGQAAARQAKGQPWAPRGAIAVDTDARREEVRQSVMLFIQQGHAEKVAAHWPPSVPTFKASESHTEGQLRQIEEALKNIELEVGFVLEAPAEPEPQPEPPVPPRPDVIDEGPDIGPEAAGRLRAQLDLLESRVEGGRAQCEAWAMEAHAKGRSISVKQLRSQRRKDIVMALIAVIDAVGADADAESRALVAVALGEDIPESCSTGGAIGALDIVGADRLRRLALALSDGKAQLRYVDDGLPVIDVSEHLNTQLLTTGA